MNLIYEKVPDVRWYSDLQPFVAALGNRVHDYYWRFDAVEACITFPVDEREDGYWILTGDEFETLVENHPLFDWAVVSAIATQCTESEVASPCSPYADCNPAFWIGSPKPQHPHANFELVCWDSSATLLIGADDEIVTAFKVAYPESLDLDRENANRDRTKP